MLEMDPPEYRQSVNISYDNGVIKTFGHREEIKNGIRYVETLRQTTDSSGNQPVEARWIQHEPKAVKASNEDYQTGKSKEADSSDVVKTEKPQSPLMLSCIKGHSDVAKILLKQGADVNFRNDEGTTPIMAASKNGHTDTVKLLCRFGADVNAKNENLDTSVMFASSNGNVDILKHLIENGANLDYKNKHGWTPLMFAAHFGHAEATKLLSQYGAY